MAVKLPPFRLRNEYFFFLLPLFFVLHGFSENYPLIPLSDVLSLLMIYLLGSAILLLLSTLIFQSWRKGFLLTLALMSFHFFFGGIHDLVKWLMPLTVVVKYVFLLPILLGLFAWLVIYLRRTKRGFNRFTSYMNLLLLLLIALDLVQLGIRISKKNPNPARPAGFVACDSCTNPDIYLILADEYPGNKELKDIFGFNNEGFEHALREKGFHIVNNSVSNYNYTPFSMASLFTMDYLQGIEGRNQSKGDRKICYRLINKNPVLDFLRSQGYSIRNYSVFQFNDELPPAHSSFFLTGKDLLTSQTFLTRLDRDVRFNLVTRYRIKSEMKRLAMADLNSLNTIYDLTWKEVEKDEDRPRFIYSHLMLPHYPYFYDRNGKLNPVESLMEGEQGRKKEYIEYLQYSNQKYLRLIDHILGSSKKPPIIVFMGDHGFRHFTEAVDTSYHFMNLNAVYLPGKNYTGFYEGMSMVNQFRTLFNSTFNQQLPMKKDSTSFLSE